ncbi:MAG TPA: methionine--tRNA ligase [Planktothrix sp.]|jgi:methionyl-tRNA synthetase
MGKYYITTAIDYVNASPHIGHAYEKIAADILARYHRMQGDDVFFLTGVDEHGSKVEKSAAQAGKSPEQFCDEMAALFEAAWRKLNLSYDYFIRTTEERHAKVVQEVFRRALAKGDIYKSKYSGLYCEGCEDFVRDRDLDADGNCPNHKRKPITLEEENYFFKLSKYKPILKKLLTEKPDMVLPEGRRREVLNNLDDEELGDFSVSRSRRSLNWGIPVPDDPDQVIYVWIDALTNYITGVGFQTDEAQFKRYWPADLHLIGKDITKFHSIYWPAFLMSADVEVPQHIYAHGFITVEGQKLSKSLGNVIDPNALVDQYGADAVRFFLFAQTPFDQDGDFSRELFRKTVNAQLANNLGNLLNRTLNLLDKNCHSTVPKAEMEHVLNEACNSIHGKYIELMNEFEFAKAINAVFTVVDQANKYYADEAPWTLFKQGKQAEAEKILYTGVEVLRRAAMYLYPFIPTLASGIWRQLGFAGDITDYGKESDSHGFFDHIAAGQRVNNEGPLFKRIEEEVEAKK